MVNRKVLILTYYWPPSGGSGVQRWLKFVKYLPQQGWKPFVLTPSNPSFTINDDSLLKDVPSEAVVRTLPIWEPYDLFFRISGWLGKKEIKATDFVSTASKKTLFQQWSAWIRGNLFIPDARIFWVKPAAGFAEQWIREEGIQTIITTGPPHSLHLVGLRLKRKFPDLKWIADFRDPWSEWDVLDTLSLSRRSRKRHTELEHEVLVTADRVVTISPYHVARLEALGGRKVDLITNGFDEEDFNTIVRNRTTHFTIRHVGVVDELRDPRPVMEVLNQLCETDPDFARSVKVEFVGNVNSAFREFVTSHPKLNSVTSFVDHVPHQQLLRLYGETDVQLLVLAHTAIGPGNLPGKFFEYLASHNLILALGPADGDAGEILKRTGSGVIYERSDLEGIKAALKDGFSKWKGGAVLKAGDISAFTRKALTARLASLLESLPES